MTRPEPGKGRVIDESGEQLGIIEIVEAYELAKEKDLDLVEMDPHSTPPIFKLMNYGRFKYNQSKRKQKAKKTIRKRKEVKLRPKTEEHDFQVKARRARKFLEEGHKVLVTLIFRGREQRHPELGFNLLEKFKAELEEVSKIEKEPSREGGNRLGMILAPK